MNRVEKILCPIDLKEDNDKVLITAASVARAFQAELVLAYITPKFVNTHSVNLTHLPKILL